MKRRRRWLWVLLAGSLLLAGGLLAREGWVGWEERLARQALAGDHLAQARRHIDRALWLGSGRVSTRLLAARIARLEGNFSQAEQHLSRCGSRQEMAGPVQLEWVLLRCQRGKVDEVAPDLLALVDRDHPESPAILEALAAVYMQQARYLEALSCLDRWVERDPDSPRALHWRGWVSNQLDHRAQAIGDYEHLLELQPDQSEVRQHLSEILLDSTRHPEALPHLERLYEEQPANPRVLVGLARCRVAQGNMEEAQALLDEALREEPDYFDALLHRGKLELSIGDPARAERWLRQALKRSPRDPDARYALSQSLQRQPKRQQEAKQEEARWKEDRRIQTRLTRLLRTELNSRPNDPDLARETGELLLQQGEDERGLFWLRRALALSPAHAATLRALIAYYERTNNPAQVAEYRRQLAASGSGR
jgi:tetratricopeptide (TPR) repeat protein